MGRCKLCNRESIIISQKIGYCVSCVRENFSKLEKEIKEIHKNLRRQFSLPEEIPNFPNGKNCGQCVNNC
ncbi:MAG: hypothetical protein N2323_07030 [candidate division WOR-3 bacterium]|nr:hypothetical protein [candidate division WOR-3 bacterium]